MTSHFTWLHLPHWRGHGPVNRAMTLVLGVIGVSLAFSALRVVDAAVSGALVAAPAAAGPADLLIGTEPTSAGTPVDASLVDIPDAAATAISL